MSLILTCEINADALPHLTSLRAQHLEYIQAHRSEILFGGPARDENGIPQTMIIVLATDDTTAAREFVASEPYTASGKVFASVSIRPWSQVIPEPTPGALDAAIADERAKASS
ncbi:YciI family protein [Mycobacterium sp.]|uniref:YciI family protein n=1 Tax=Mycobacterium sp. TaxID=1785 RepID=UPI003D0E7450